MLLTSLRLQVGRKEATASNNWRGDNVRGSKMELERTWGTATPISASPVLSKAERQKGREEGKALWVEGVLSYPHRGPSYC